MRPSTVAAIVILPFPSVASAQGLSARATPVADLVQHTPDGFRFQPPRVTFGMRVGFNLARAGSGVFDLATEQLTLDRTDFSAFMGAGEIGITVSGPIDVVFGTAHARISRASEFRDFVDQNDLPIRQQTTFSQTPITAAVRLYLTPRGRRIGRFAWVPARLSPYVGAGGGVVHYTFQQVGSFVDFQNLDIFEDAFESSGWAPLAVFMTGLDYSLSDRVVINTDVRYQVASGGLDNRFAGFTDGIDLNGLQISGGVRLRL